MEIIVLPYMAISLLVGWAIFAPFAAIDEFERWSFSKVETSDLLTIILATSFLLAATNWLRQAIEIPWFILATIFASIILFVTFTFFTGLFLLAKLEGTPSIKRAAIIGIIIPFGSVLTFGWIALPMLAFTGSGTYSILATLVTVVLTVGLRAMSNWVCSAT